MVSDQITPIDVNDNRSMPPGKIIPELVYDNLDSAVRWLSQAFGFEERLRIGNHRSQLVLEGASLIAIGKKDPPEIKVNDSGHSHPVRQADHSIMVRVDDVEQHFQREIKSGAQVINPPSNFPYGERQYSVQDIGGHIWTFSQSIADVNPEDWGGVLRETNPGGR